MNDIEEFIDVVKKTGVVYCHPSTADSVTRRLLEVTPGPGPAYLGIKVIPCEALEPGMLVTCDVGFKFKESRAFLEQLASVGRPSGESSPQ